MNSEEISVREAVDGDHQMWNDLVESCPGANIAQRFEWRAILGDSETPGKFLIVQREDEILGLFPFRLLDGGSGTSMVSPPYYCDDGPVMLGIAGKVGEVLLKYARMMRPPPWMFRISSTRPELLEEPVESGKCNMVLELGSGPEDTMRKYSASTRRKVRRSCEGVDLIHDPVDGIARFYRLYEGTMLEKGAWTKSEEFFEILRSSFEGNPRVRVCMARRGDEDVGGLVYSLYKGRAILLYSGWDSSNRRENANFALVQSAIEDAHHNGFHEVDFGLTPFREDDGLYQFKSRWGARPRQIFDYQRVLDLKAALVDKIRRAGKRL